MVEGNISLSDGSPKSQTGLHGFATIWDERFSFFMSSKESKGLARFSPWWSENFLVSHVVLRSQKGLDGLQAGYSDSSCHTSRWHKWHLRRKGFELGLITTQRLPRKSPFLHRSNETTQKQTNRPWMKRKDLPYLPSVPTTGRTWKAHLRPSTCLTWLPYLSYEPGGPGKLSPFHCTFMSQPSTHTKLRLPSQPSSFRLWMVSWWESRLSFLAITNE